MSSAAAPAELLRPSPLLRVLLQPWRARSSVDGDEGGGEAGGPAGGGPAGGGPAGGPAPAAAGTAQTRASFTHWPSRSRRLAFVLV